MKLARVPVYDRCAGLADVWKHVRDDVVDKATFLYAAALTRHSVLIKDVDGEAQKDDRMVNLLFTKGSVGHIVATTATAFRKLFDFEPPECYVN